MYTSVIVHQPLHTHMLFATILFTSSLNISLNPTNGRPKILNHSGYFRLIRSSISSSGNREYGLSGGVTGDSINPHACLAHPCRKSGQEGLPYWHDLMPFSDRVFSANPSRKSVASLNTWVKLGWDLRHLQQLTLVLLSFRFLKDTGSQIVVLSICDELMNSMLLLMVFFIFLAELPNERSLLSVAVLQPESTWLRTFMSLSLMAPCIPSANYWLSWAID